MEVVSGGVVTQDHLDLCVFHVMCPTPAASSGHMRYWPDQKLVHPLGVMTDCWNGPTGMPPSLIEGGMWKVPERGRELM